MRSRLEPAGRAAHAIVERLRHLELLEATDPDRVTEELGSLLERFEHGVLEAVAAVGRPQSVVEAQRAFLEALAERGLPQGEQAESLLCATLASMLEDTDHVDEIYADDETLSRILSAAMMDFVGSIDALASKRLREVVRGDSAHDEPERSPTLAERGYAFPLFDAPVEHADVGDAGPCRICRGAADLRFEGACYACFRGHRGGRTVDTERGAISPTSAQAEPLRELTHTPTYYSRQGEAWLFCCDAPMTFIGNLVASPGDRCERLDALCEELDASREDVLRTLLGAEEAPDPAKTLEDLMCARLDVHAFRCGACGRRRGYSER